MLSPVTHFLPVTCIRRTRMLPVPGRVLVRKGQKVNATDVIAEAILEPEHLLLEIARGLGVPADKADEHIQLKSGESVDQGDVVAGPVGMTRRVIRAPKAGRVVAAGSGQVLLEVESRSFELRAGIPGTVTDLIADYGAEIETNGSLIQGVWGNGKVDDGLLDVAIRSPEDELTTDRLDVSQRGSILLAGHCGDASALNTAAEIPLRGLILASMDSALISVAERMQYPIVLIEGFGNLPLNPLVYKLLTTNERRDVVLKADRWDRLAGSRPEIVIPLPTQGNQSPPVDVLDYAPGCQVRIKVAGPGMNVGTITTLLPGLAVLPGGIKARAAEVRLDSGESAVFPLANLDVLK